MKSILKYFVPMTAAVVALASCNKEKDNKVETPKAPALHITVTATPDELQGDADVEADSKTYIDNKTIKWGTGEYMKIGVFDGSETVFGDSSSESADSGNGSVTHSFSFDITPATASGDYTYYGLYPLSAASTSNNTDPASYKVILPASQSATAASYDPKAYILVAKPESGKTVTNPNWNAWFRRATALNKVTLTNLPEDIKRVKITAPDGKYLAGGRYVNLTTGYSGEIYNGGGRTETVEVRFASKQSHESPIIVWFTSWDAEILVGSNLTIVAYSDAHTYTRTLTVVNKSITFKEGYLNTLNVNMATAVQGDNTELDEGDYVILAKNNTTYYALKGEATGTRLVSVDYTGSLDSYAGTGDIVWSVAASGGSYTVKNGTNYLGWTSGSGNAASLISEEDYSDAKCLMDITYGNSTYLLSVKNDSSRKLARNTSNEYFAFYTGTQYKDLVFVPATALETVATPTFSPASGEVTSGTEVEISCATDGATIHYTVDGTDPTSSSASYSSPISITATTTIKAIAVKDGMANSEVATAQYTIAGVTDYSVIETSNVTLTAGTNGSAARVNSEEAIKVGTSNKGGDMIVTVPVGTTKLHLHAAAWNGVNGLSLNISGATVSPTSIALTADSGISNNSPFTLGGNPADFYFELELSDITADTEITFTSSIAKRFVVWGVNAEAGTPATPKVATPTISISGSQVSISCATEDATIYYSLNGATEEEYSAPIDISGSNSATIEAFALKTDYEDSDVASEIYYAVNVNSTTNGSVTAVPFAAQDDEVSLTITPESGYALDQLSVLDENDDEVTVTNNKFTMPASPVFVTATFDVLPAGNDGSLEHPYTVAEALVIIAGYSDKEKSDNQVYVSGIIANVGSYNSTYHSVTYDISDDGANANTPQYL